jgi:Asp/Glu/hydantoin racemase
MNDKTSARGTPDKRLSDIPKGTRHRTIHGVSIGILMLDTGFQRLPGDIGHGATWRFPVQYARMAGVSGPQVMAAAAGDAAGAAPLLERFVEAAEELARLGVDGITTSCGFLLAFQQELAARCPVPVATSSLLQIPSVAALLPPGKRVGILTAKRSALTANHLNAIHAPLDLPVAGLSDDAIFFQNNLTNAACVSYEEQEADIMDCAARLMAEHPEVGAIVSECANFAPYSHKIAATFNVPVFDIVTLIEWFHNGLQPRRY